MFVSQLNLDPVSDAVKVKLGRQNESEKCSKTTTIS